MITVSSGGFGDSARFVLVLAGSTGLLVSAVHSPSRLSLAISKPPVIGLLGLTILGSASLLWADVEWDSAILFALTPAAYAGVAVLAACENELRGREEFVGICLAILATAAAVTGLLGVLFEIEPWAILLGGRLRPAGFVEYPPALALLQLGAMPILARGVLSPNRLIAKVAGASLMTGAAAVFLSQSRVVLLLAGLLITAWVIWPERTLAVHRRESIDPAALWVIGGLVLFLAIRALDPWPAVAICVVTLLAAPWLVERALKLLGRPAKSHSDRVTSAHRVAAALLLSFAVLAALAVLAIPDRSTRGVQAEQGLDHGRIDLWTSSVDAISEKPLLGHGQGSFLSATGDEQEEPVRFAHNQIVESAVELGVIGALFSAVVLLSPLIYVWRRRRDPTAWICIPMIVGFCALGLVDWVWYLTGVGAIWAFCLGCILIAPPQEISTGIRKAPDRKPRVASS